MLDDIFPVQFVEGLNEGAELSSRDSIVISSYSRIGILYVPKVSYSLTKIEIMLTFGNLKDGDNIKIDVCSDYEERPTDIVLSSGTFTPETPHGGWKEIGMEPVSILKNRRYWVTINPNDCITAFIVPNNGEDITLTVQNSLSNKWGIPHKEDIKNSKIMVKFYGRIFPVSVSSAPLST